MGKLVTWLTPAELDREKLRWRRHKGQHGGWDQALWVVLQDEWRRALLSDPSMVVIYAGGAA